MDFMFAIFLLFLTNICFVLLFYENIKECSIFKFNLSGGLSTEN